MRKIALPASNQEVTGVQHILPFDFRNPYDDISTEDRESIELLHGVPIAS